MPALPQIGRKSDTLHRPVAALQSSTAKNLQGDGGVAAQISDNLERFIRERLPSVEQIEIVLLLRRDNTRAWSAPEVAEQLGTPPESTAMRLFLLASNGILSFEGSGVPRYRFETSDPAFDSLLVELEQVYNERRDALFELVGAPARDPVRSFADAFKLKK